MKTYSVPVSVKGIVFENGKVWLRKNERNEWELPGGKIDKDEQPEKAVVREVKEELGFKTEVLRTVRAYLHKVKSSKDEREGVLVVSYLCKLISKIGTFETQGEGGEAKFQKFTLEEVDSLRMPKFYKDVIHLAWKIHF